MSVVLSPGAAAAAGRFTEGRPPRRVLALVALGLLAALGSSLAFGAALVNPDSVYGLIWGRELAGGELAGFDPGPTPHPLPIAIAAAASPLGDDANYLATYLFFGPLAFGALIAGVFDLAWRLASPWAGCISVALVLTSEMMTGWAATARYDVAFTALVLIALGSELARPRRAVAPLVALALAGTIRPEAWLIAGAYWLLLVREMSPPRRVRLGALVLVAPVVWCVMDWRVTGDPLWSFHVTEDASDRLYGRFSKAENLEQGAGDLIRCIGLVPLLLLVASVRRRSAAALPVMALLAAALACFLALLALGMPSSERYLLLPASLIAVLAGVTATTWRPAPRAAGLVVLALLGAQVLLRADAVPDVRKGVQASAERTRQTRALARQPEVRALMSRCPTVAIPSFQLLARWSYYTGRALDRWTIDAVGASRPDVFVAPASVSAAQALLTRPRFDRDARFGVPPSLARGRGTSDWQIYVDRSAACVRAASSRRAFID